jgi:excisionase family DNA binding protein
MKLILSITEAASHLGLRERAVVNLTKRGLLPHRKIGKDLFFDQFELDAWWAISKNEDITDETHREPLKRDAIAKAKQVVRDCPDGQPCVYLLRLGQYHKIGKTIHLTRRVAEFISIFPEDPELIHTIQTAQHSSLEAFLHQRFSRQRVKGEWFRLTENDIDWIRHISPDATGETMQ